MGPRAVWSGAEDLASAGIRSPNRSASNQKLRRLNYCCPLVYPESERVNSFPVLDRRATGTLTSEFPV